MTQERVDVMIRTYHCDCFRFDACYEDYKDLINKTKEECKRRYKNYCLLGIFLKDGTYLKKDQNKWLYVNNRLQNEIITEIQ